MVPEVATRVAHTTTLSGHAPDPRGPLVRRLMLYFGRKKDNFWKKYLGEGFNPIGVTNLRI